LQVEHFIYALINDGYKLAKSPGAEKLLSEDNFQVVCHIGDKMAEPTQVQMWFPTENVYALSLIEPTNDKFGRRGTWNHTILIKLGDFLPSLMSQFLIHKTEKLPKKLEPIKVERV